MNSNKKNCWIIGASHGIGEALAKKYYSENFDLILSARSKEKLDKIKEELVSSNSNLANKPQILTSKVDVSELDSLQKTFDQIIQNYQKIDLVIFCSALYQPTEITKFDLQLVKEVININLIGCFNLLQVIVAPMIVQKFGQIAITASVAGYRGLPKSLAYGASKAALINMCEGIYPELKKQNIDLSLINPGFVKTRLTDKNSFKMPFIVTPEKAAEEIFIGLKAKKFEIHFPKKFTFLLKLLRILPYPIFFFLTKKIA